MIFSNINDVVKIRRTRFKGKFLLFCQSTFIKQKLLWKCIMGDAPFCETFIRYFSMIPPIFSFLSFFSLFATSRTLKFYCVLLLCACCCVVCSNVLRSLLFYCMFEVWTTTTTRRYQCRCRDVAWMRNNMLLANKYSTVCSQARHSKLDCVRAPFQSAECFFRLALLLHNLPHTYSFTENFYNKWHFLGSWKEMDGDATWHWTCFCHVCARKMMISVYTRLSSSVSSSFLSDFSRLLLWT